jgi:hypothetical protein
LQRWYIRLKTLPTKSGDEFLQVWTLIHDYFGALDLAMLAAEPE